MSAAKERQTSVYFANHLLSNHTCANCLIWKTSVNCVSDLSRRDKCLLKLKNKILLLLIDCCVRLPTSFQTETIL